MKPVKKELNRHLTRLRKYEKSLQALRVNNEDEYTYWAEWELGYTQGKITEIENILDLIEDGELNEKN